MKATSLISTVLAAALLSLVPTQQANAVDTKMYAGSGCKVFGSTAWTDLQFGAAGITNLTGVAKNVICPIVKDSEGDWDNGVTNPASLHFHLHTGNNSQVSTCNVYVNAYDGSLQSTRTVAVGGTPNSDTYADLYYFDDGAAGYSTHEQATMLCTLAPGARLNYYYVYETTATDS